MDQVDFWERPVGANDMPSKVQRIHSASGTVLFDPINIKQALVDSFHGSMILMVFSNRDQDEVEKQENYQGKLSLADYFGIKLKFL